MIRALPITALCLALIACQPQTDDPAPAPEQAPAPLSIVTDAETGPDGPLENVFLGRWKQTGAQTAPWWKGDGEPPAPNPDFTSTDLVITPSTVEGPTIAACAAPAYRVVQSPVESLFEGNLPDPWNDAKALGLQGSYATTLETSCGDAYKDVTLQFPMVDAGTILLGLDNVIYTFERQPG